MINVLLDGLLQDFQRRIDAHAKRAIGGVSGDEYLKLVGRAKGLQDAIRVVQELKASPSAKLEDIEDLGDDDASTFERGSGRR